jgi:hypothetical protein
MFGNLYELGPAWVNESLQLVHNPGKVCLLVRSITCSGSKRLHSSWQIERIVFHGRYSLLSFEPPLCTWQEPGTAALACCLLTSQLEVASA